MPQLRQIFLQRPRVYHHNALALRYRQRVIVYSRILFTSFIAYSFGHTLGFAAFTGAAIRFRLYSTAKVTAIDVSPLDAGLLDAVVRLVRLLDSPTDARVLAPLVTREIVYRLLMGTQGARLRHIAVLGGDTHRIARVVDLLRKDLQEPLRVESIAQELGMSVSGLYHQFKAITAMSPLQFQKRLRLQEARRLMLGEHLDAASAGFRVGYDDAAHFNREYKSLFGLPPMRDVERLREAAETVVRN